MDQLDRDEMEARKHGLSYGQYIAKFKPPKPPVEGRLKKKDVQLITGQQKRPQCACCGKEIPEDSRSRKYCGPECAHIYRKLQDNARHKRLRETIRTETEE